jgi:hypothetical protein
LHEGEEDELAGKEWSSSSEEESGEEDEDAEAATDEEVKERTSRKPTTERANPQATAMTTTTQRADAEDALASTPSVVDPWIELNRMRDGLMYVKRVEDYTKAEVEALTALEFTTLSTHEMNVVTH